MVWVQIDVQITFDIRSIDWKISLDIDRTSNVLLVTRMILNKHLVLYRITKDIHVKYRNSYYYIWNEDLAH